MSVSQMITTKGHEQVAFFQDSEVGLLAIIAVHDTTLGPSLGGCRMKEYESVDDALYDVLRLSEGMTYKNSLCGNNIGGGKAVIVKDSRMNVGREALFRSYGRCVERMGGSYITAEDMGTSVSDMETVHKETEHVAGLDPKKGGGGDPSPWTALGVFDGMRACLERVFGTPSYQGKHVAIQGVGHVGRYLAQHLKEQGAVLTFSDPREDRLAEACKEFDAKAVSVEEIYSVECDVFAPCAVGAILNSKTVPQLRCKIVAGAANNQIQGGETEPMLKERGIMYAPDFAINAGGVILCASEREPGGHSKPWVEERVALIYGTVAKILDQAKETGELTGSVAVRLAQERISEAKRSARG